MAPEQTMKKLSIIVPVYNMAADGKLEYCIDSLLAQTMAPEDYEIIAVDDASADESYEILQGYEKKYPGRITALRSPVNHHQGGAKNIGLAYAEGSWIGFMDADDWAAPEMYGSLLAAAEEAGADMAGCDYHLTDHHGMDIGKVVHNNREEQAGELDTEKYRKLILDPGSLVVKIYRRELILGDLQPAGSMGQPAGSAEQPAGSAGKPSGSAGQQGEAAGGAELRNARVFPEDIFYEDNAVCKTWMLRAKRFVYLPQPWYYYYQHGGSTVHTISKRNLEDRKTAGRLMMEEAKRQNYLETYRPEMEFSFTVLFYINTLFSAMPRRQKIAGRYAFTKQLAQEMRETFPAFQENAYYQARIPAEEKKLIAMQMRSHLMFYVYYKLLWLYRDLRGKR